MCHALAVIDFYEYCSEQRSKRRKRKQQSKLKILLCLGEFFLLHFCLNEHFIDFNILFFFYHRFLLFLAQLLCVYAYVWTACYFLSKNIWLTGLSNVCEQAHMLLLCHFAALEIILWQKRIKENSFFESRTLNNYKSLATAQLEWCIDAYISI